MKKTTSKPKKEKVKVIYVEKEKPSGWRTAGKAIAFIIVIGIIGFVIGLILIAPKDENMMYPQLRYVAEAQQDYSPVAAMNLDIEHTCWWDVYGRVINDGVVNAHGVSLDCFIKTENMLILGKETANVGEVTSGSSRVFDVRIYVPCFYEGKIYYSCETFCSNC